jgi:phosphoadenosine phosphosulfate reductase
LTSTRNREIEFNRWPKYKAAYLHAFKKMLEYCKTHGTGWKKRGADGGDPTVSDIWNWWMEYDVLPGQVNLFEDFEETEAD